MPRARSPRAAAFLLVAAGLASGAPAARAQTSPADAAAAQALFDEAKALMKAGHFDQACPKLEESQRLDAGGGTLLVLGLCYESLGRTGSAWATWNDALSGARSEHRPDREKLAQEHIRALEEKMPRARVNVPTPPRGVEVRRDGELLGPAQWGTAVPIDPGTHAFDATAPGKVPWHESLVVAAERKVYEVNVPELQDAAIPPPAPAPPAPATAAPAPSPPQPVPPPAPPPAPPASSSNPLRTAAFVSGGVAIAARGAGAILTGVASAKWSDAHAACQGTLQCHDPAAVSEGNTAGHDADAATVLWAVGGVGAAAAVLLFVVSAGHGDSAPATSLHVSPLFGGGVGGVAVGGSL
jgi:serine/threonine-protein kinase